MEEGPLKADSYSASQIPEFYTTTNLGTMFTIAHFWTLSRDC
jgi:hypothetical protein